MSSKDRTERDGLASCEALLGYKIVGTEENHETLQLIKSVSGPKYVAIPTQTHSAVSACLKATYGTKRAAKLW